ncbi:MAG: hypothetical protein IRY92_11845, partial [Dactylosporangium sp.]|nr:hypothetical protein [Dactylosporangium sp.]
KRDGHYYLAYAANSNIGGTRGRLRDVVELRLHPVRHGRPPTRSARGRTGASSPTR